MVNFRREGQGTGFSRVRSSGSSRFGGRSDGPGGRSRGGFRGRSQDFRRSERRPLEMHDATCAKCGKECQVPFRPSGDKPVLCSDCFRQSEGSGRSFSPLSRDRPSSSGMSSEQLSKINEKLDKIMKALKIE